MKERFILFFATLILCIGIGGAKEQKIKYGKYVYYEGEVVNKQPMGIGKLIFVSPENKKQAIASIEGRFDNNQIYDANITSTLLPALKTTGEQPITFIPMGDMGKINTIQFDFSNVSFNGQRSVVTFGAFSTKMEIENKEWKFIRPESIPVMTDAIEVPLPSTITQYWNNPNNVLTYAKLNSGKMDIPSSKVIYNFGDYFLLKHFDISDKNKHAFYKGSVNVKGIDFLITANEDGFIIFPETAQGTRILRDGTVIKRNSQNSEIIEAVSPSGNKYIGSAISPMTLFSQSLKSFSELRFKDGTLTTPTGVTRYVNGKSEDNIKTRLNQSGVVEKDLIEKVLNRKINEQEAIAEHKRIQKEKEEKERLE